MPVVGGVFDQHFVRTDGTHPVVNAVAAPGRFSLNVVQGCGMDYSTRGPGRSSHSRHAGDQLRRLAGIGTEPAKRLRAGRIIGYIVARNDPRTRDRILAKFHAQGDHLVEPASTGFCGQALCTGQRGITVCYNPPTKPPEMTEPSTPLMRQYAAIKKEHPSALLFFRLGDFYELFFDDAVLAARELQITLTSRNKEKGVDIPMCGVPHHAAEAYISKLIRKGFKVAICEQVEDPRMAKKLVRREVTRVVTPGTAADSSLSSEENNFLAAVATVGDRVGFAALDLSTGEFRATEFRGEDAARRIQEEIQQLRPKEVLYGSKAPLFEGSRVAAAPLPQSPAGVSPAGIPAAGGYAETPLDDWVVAAEHAIPLLQNHFGVLSLERFGLSGKPAAAAAAGAILYYVRST